MENQTRKKRKTRAVLLSTTVAILAIVMNFIVSIGAMILFAILYFLQNGMDSGIGGSDEQVYGIVDNIVEMVMNHAYLITMIYMVATFLILLLIFKIKKRKLSDYIIFKKIAPLSSFLFVPLAVTLSMCLNGILELLSKFITLPGLESARELTSLGDAPLWIKLLSIALVAPFFEEFVFRGIIFTRLKKDIAIPWAIILQALLFGIVHMNITQGLYAFVLGIVFGYFVYSYQSILPGLMMHIAINAYATLGSHFASETQEVASSVREDVLFILITFAITLLFGIALRYIKRRQPSKA